MTLLNVDYPVRLEIDRPEHLNRLLPFVKRLLAIPHYIALLFLGIGAYVVTIISFFAVLITGRDLRRGRLSPGRRLGGARLRAEALVLR